MTALRSGTLWTIVAASVVIISYQFLKEYPVIGVLTPFIAYLSGLLLGMAKGISKEKTRVVSLCRQVFDVRMSGSVRRVLNGIEENRIRLLTEDEFFGPEPGVPSVQATNGAQERPSPDP